MPLTVSQDAFLKALLILTIISAFGFILRVTALYRAPVPSLRPPWGYRNKTSFVSTGLVIFISTLILGILGLYKMFAPPFEEYFTRLVLLIIVSLTSFQEDWGLSSASERLMAFFHPIVTIFIWILFIASLVVGTYLENQNVYLTQAYWFSKLYQWKRQYDIQYNGTQESDTTQHPSFLKYITIAIHPCLDIACLISSYLAIVFLRSSISGLIGLSFIFVLRSLTASAVFVSNWVAKAFQISTTVSGSEVPLRRIGSRAEGQASSLDLSISGPSSRH
ncbi:hypothetical protein DER44DRAFT_748426 [Fusarium oxysporum]|nr:hypothetical protein DER44DRAFT_748426 [Fusarium oxysporum]